MWGWRAGGAAHPHLPGFEGTGWVVGGSAGGGVSHADVLDPGLRTRRLFLQAVEFFLVRFREAGQPLFKQIAPVVGLPP